MGCQVAQQLAPYAATASSWTYEVVRNARTYSLTAAACTCGTCFVFRVMCSRYGTHFVSGVGHRGAFVGAITVKLQDLKVAAGASASFKASYGKVSGMAELKAQMQDSLKTSDVMVSDTPLLNQQQQRKRQQWVLMSCSFSTHGIVMVIGPA